MKSYKQRWLISFVTMLTVTMMVSACGSSGSGSKGASTTSTTTETSAGTSKETSTSNAATNYPEKAITVIAPSGAGGGLDATARALSKVMKETNLVSESIIVENRPGGGQAVGIASFVNKDGKDSHKLFLPSAPIIINHYKKEGNSPYSHKDLKPLAQLTKDYGAIVVKADSKYKDLTSVLDDLKAKPGDVTIAGGSAPGSQDHLIAMLPAVKAGVDPKTIKFVSYDGGGEALTALLGGNADVLSSDISGLGQYLKSGKVRVLGVSAPERLSGEFAQIPTYKEQGVEAEFVIWRGVFGPKNMDPAAISFWEKALKDMTESEAWKKELATNGWENGYKNAADFEAFLTEQEKSIQEILGSLSMLK
ncbi:tripartite tricarboxylate transporter substrate binding protein [Paenibacillus sp. 481]|uniref:tripartite tricarboxylate transporter substrate binding protein n=1 Tax=Paenibacillus sp. 481 TaxID=2835869 RepID=UPI001E5ED4CE|nr:tripartite tricarboxylate transporter substrate binding protein [Paenibacillus sp. 481]UHA75092.1 tripartite tricarboxylate transporter substrate binding protein [Paenibacillus sp. 481]